MHGSMQPFDVVEQVAVMRGRFDAQDVDRKQEACVLVVLLLFAREKGAHFGLLRQYSGRQKGHVSPWARLSRKF